MFIEGDRDAKAGAGGAIAGRPRALGCDGATIEVPEALRSAAAVRVQLRGIEDGPGDNEARQCQGRLAGVQEALDLSNVSVEYVRVWSMRGTSLSAVYPAPPLPGGVTGGQHDDIYSVCDIEAKQASGSRSCFRSSDSSHFRSGSWRTFTNAYNHASLAAPFLAPPPPLTHLQVAHCQAVEGEDCVRGHAGRVKEGEQDRIRGSWVLHVGGGQQDLAEVSDGEEPGGL